MIRKKRRSRSSFGSGVYKSLPSSSFTRARSRAALTSSLSLSFFESLNALVAFCALKAKVEGTKRKGAGVDVTKRSRGKRKTQTLSLSLSETSRRWQGRRGRGGRGRGGRGRGGGHSLVISPPERCDFSSKCELFIKEKKKKLSRTVCCCCCRCRWREKRERVEKEKKKIFLFLSL